MSRRRIEHSHPSGEAQTVARRLGFWVSRLAMKKLPMRRQPASKPARLCPECGSTDIAPIIHGIPTRKQAQQIKAGRAVLADREEWEGMTEWYCKSCGCDWGPHFRRFKKPGSVNATRG
jgi:hypothetical protein